MTSALLLLLACRPVAGPQGEPGDPHAVAVAWDALLKDAVHDGYVDYDEVEKRRDALDDYLVLLAQPTGHNPKFARHSFWVNAYNALVIYQVLEQGRPETVRTHEGWDGMTGADFFSEPRFIVGGELVTLHDIKHKKIRMQSMDFRSHAVLVGGARSGPPLRAGLLPEQGHKRVHVPYLDVRMKAWVMDPERGVRIGSDGVPEFNPIFRWYQRDFNVWSGGYGLCIVAASYADGEIRAGLLDAAAVGCPHRFYAFDWRLNQSRREEHPRVPEAEAKVVALSAAPFARLEVPSNSRPQGKPPVRVPLRGPWKHTKRKLRTKHKQETAGKHLKEVWQARLPIRPRGLFFHKPPPGMTVTDSEGEPVLHRFHQTDTSARHWTCDRDTFTLHNWGEAPADGALFVAYDKAIERERALNFDGSGAASKEDFVRTTVQVDEQSLTGLLLPAPSIASFELEMPKAAQVWFRPGIAPAEIRDAAVSDGAQLVVTFTPDSTGAPVTVYDELLREGEFEDQVIHLDAFAGQTGTLTFESRAGRRGDARFDYVFLGEPVLGSRKDNPRNVYLVFIDTLRPDHTGPYGYSRETTPFLDQLAGKAVVFEAARSVAPWTLPSARTVVTGRQPEAFEAGPTLQSTLREAGYGTYMVAGNLFLGANFGMHKDWGRHQVTLWPSATQVVDDALAYLDSHQGQDSLLLVHFMDVHLPYLEDTYAPLLRHKWAKHAPPELPKEEFNVFEVRRSVLDPAGRQYVVDRYDQNILYVDRELNRLLERVDDNDILVVFSDHGEEFWDHDGFEHGHTLYDELLRVPLIIRAPNVAAGRVSAPVSLLDVTPTVLELLGLPFTGDGTSLVGAMQGDDAARARLLARDQVFGRPLHSTEAWGVLHRDHKWTAREGGEELYDLSTDPGEKRDLMEPGAGDRYHGYLAEVLGREVTPVYRLTADPAPDVPEHDLITELTVPGGVAEAWIGVDPTRKSSASMEVDGDVVRVVWEKGWKGTVPVYIRPTAPFEAVTPGLSLAACYGDSYEIAMGNAITRTSQERAVVLSTAISPVPVKDGTTLDGTDPELMEELQAMGYVVGDDAAPTTSGVSAATARCRPPPTR